MYLAALNLIDPNSTHLPHPTTTTTLGTILTDVFVIIGALALFLMVLAGFRYIISAGDANKTAEAKRMIVYTAVGVVVSATAATIVNFIVGRLGQ